MGSVGVSYCLFFFSTIQLLKDRIFVADFPEKKEKEVSGTYCRKPEHGCS